MNHFSFKAGENTRRAATLIALFGVSATVYAAGADLGQAAKQATNWTAIIMFGAFVVMTLFITKWAAAKTKSAADFYTAGGGITGFQNGLAIAGDYMSAASFLGISAAVMASGFDGLIYSIGFLVGWPVITFLMAERPAQPRQVHLRRRGRLPLQAGPGAHLRCLGHAGGGGLLPDRADGGCGPADQAAVRPGVLDRGW